MSRRFPTSGAPESLRRGSENERARLRLKWACEACGGKLADIYLEGRSSVVIKCRCNHYNTLPPPVGPEDFDRIDRYLRNGHRVVGDSLLDHE